MMNNNDIFYNQNKQKNHGNPQNNYKHQFNTLDFMFQSPGIQGISYPANALSYNQTNNGNNEDSGNNINQFMVNSMNNQINTLSPQPSFNMFYNNTQGVNTPDKYTVALDSKYITGATANDFIYNQVTFTLLEPIILDSITDVYLEYINLQNLVVCDSAGTIILGHLEASSQFYIYIEELNIKVGGNNSFQNNKLFIPNDIYGKGDFSPNDNLESVVTYLLKLKSNFLCQLQPTKISKLTVTLRAENQNGADGSDDTTYYYLRNRVPDGDNYNSVGALKLGLHFEKKL